ncbi:hypothetical protein [Streptosporangium sp. NPDC002721]|uniref:hypothetical protein n=1 Tax=Streptosporangium sp. NPDC002721 TaxID=3366188 RepID=UPI00369E70B3
MATGPEFSTLFESDLDVDTEVLREQTRRGAAIVGDDDIRLLNRQNRIALAKGPTVEVPAEPPCDPTQSYFDIPLTCIVHAHPRCRFRWARLVVDFSGTAKAVIRDMSPREIRGESPVEIKTIVGAALNFEVVPTLLSAETSRERSETRTVYYPQILSSGPSFQRGYWDFLSLQEEYPHSDRELRLLVSAPTGTRLKARFRLKAEVALRSTDRILPLLARGGEIDETYLLT